MNEKINKNKLICSFCGTTEKDVNFLIEGEDAYICDICIEKANEIVIEKLTALSKNDKNNEKPEQIKSTLDKYIIDHKKRLITINSNTIISIR